jgi:hypothetical protein
LTTTGSIWKRQRGRYCSHSQRTIPPWVIRRPASPVPVQIDLVNGTPKSQRLRARRACCVDLWINLEITEIHRERDLPAADVVGMFGDDPARAPSKVARCGPDDVHSAASPTLRVMGHSATKLSG